MSALYNNFSEASLSMAPAFAFLIGAAGSLHCVGMCGGLALVGGKTKTESWTYNMGRLAGYLSLALVFALLGAIFTDPLIKRIFTLTAGLIAGIFLILMGVQSIKGREPKIRIPVFEKIYQFLFRRSLGLSFGRSFGLGYSSILLPCAISNGFILAALSLSEGKLWALALVIFFWAGTLPAMVMGPSLANQVAQKYGRKARVFLGVMFLIGGFASLAAKFIAAWEAGYFCYS